MVDIFRIFYRAPYGDTYTHADPGSLEKTIRQILKLGPEYAITGVAIVSAARHHWHWLGRECPLAALCAP